MTFCGLLSPMLFERQRLLLTLLDAIGGPVGRTDFQKLLFLYTKDCESTPSYEFVPYRFGAFSFTSYADKRKLIAEGLLADDENYWSLTEEGRGVARKQSVEPLQVASFCRKYTNLRGNALVAEQYRRFPYHATRSEILDKLKLGTEDLARIGAAKPPRRKGGVVTIGYEGRSLENYLNLLLVEGVTLLCDVRRNPLSRKYGFSKGTLSKACEGVGIRYEHLPELGIASDQRRELHTQKDYDTLFEEYERGSLLHEGAALEQIGGWIRAGERVALTCFERLPHQCHRHCVAEALERSFGSMLVAQHL
ncbi:MAG TPA: DUF488 domain-containing protein [Candidatus Limnocylindria bacterium]|nr:DUF488 domain-containing protein [Candidatus Limnocylindria bacterium]